MSLPKPFQSYAEFEREVLRGLHGAPFEDSIDPAVVFDEGDGVFDKHPPAPKTPKKHRCWRPYARWGPGASMKFALTRPSTACVPVVAGPISALNSRESRGWRKLT